MTAFPTITREEAMEAGMVDGPILAHIYPVIWSSLVKGRAYRTACGVVVIWRGSERGVCKACVPYGL